MRRNQAVILFFSLLPVIVLTQVPTSYVNGAEGNVAPAVTLCDNSEKVVFSCQLKSAKMISLCGSSKFTKTEGYLQYRFGLPGNIELEYPQQRSDSKKIFHYSHYFRAQVDLTEISFSANGYTYTVFSNYNGEEKPAISDQGVKVSPANKKEVSYGCRSKAKADFGDLSDVFENESSQ
jgi:hypothetical protein